VDNVRANSAGGVRLAVEHLHQLGRRRIGFVNGPIDTVPGAARARAFEETCRRLGLEESSDLRAEAEDFTVAAGRRAASILLERTSLDAVLGANDLLAVGVLKELEERGLAVPHDVAVVGMDDTELATATTPSLTSVSLRSAARGRAAARLLLERLADPDREPQRVTIQPELHVRESSQPGKGR
jgi:LacI family transcriptional regulator